MIRTHYEWLEDEHIDYEYGFSCLEQAQGYTDWRMEAENRK